MRKNKFFLLSSLTASIITAITLNAVLVFAADIPITVWVQGQLTFTANGAWGSSMPFTTYQVPGYYQNKTANWSQHRDLDVDYITFVDDNSDYDGFQILFKLTNFYKDASNTINEDKFRIIGKRSGSGNTTSTMGYDDPQHTLSIITSDSCSYAVTSNYVFNDSLTTSPYYISGAKTNQLLLSSRVDCLNMGHLRLVRTELDIASTLEAGTYTSTLTLTMIDGR